MSDKELVRGFNARKAEMAEQRERIQSEVADAIEKNGRLYDPLYDMYVDEFEDDPFGGDPYCPNDTCCACCGCDCDE